MTDLLFPLRKDKSEGLGSSVNGRFKTCNISQEEILRRRRNGGGAFYGPEVKFTTTRCDNDLLEENTLNDNENFEFDRIVVAEDMTLHATLDASADLLTRGKATTFLYPRIASLVIQEMCSCFPMIYRSLRFISPH